MTRPLPALVVLPLLCALGCAVGNPAGSSVPRERVTGNGQTSTIDRAGEFDLSVTGNGNTVTVAGGTARTLRITGNGNRVVFRFDTGVGAVALSGNGNTVELPTGAEPTSVTRTGNNNEVTHGGGNGE